MKRAWWLAINILQSLSILIVTAGLIIVNLFLLALFGSRLAYWVSNRIWAPIVLKICGAKLEVVGETNLNSSSPAVYVMNHQSIIDIPAAFIACAPIELRFVAKRELAWVPLLGFYMKATEMIFVDRGKSAKAHASLRRAAELIQRGTSIIAFPEGTRSREGKLLPFRKGAFLLAHQASVPIVPIAIAGADQVVPPDSIRLRPGRITVCIGKPIQPQPHETPMALMNQTRQAVEALYLVAAKKTFSGGPSGPDQ